jgi:2-oxoisovalerate dehydrogenase E1 component alpha subunit
MRRYLEARGALDAEADARLREEVRLELQRAVAEAEALPAKPPIATMFEDVYAEPLRQQREGLLELESALAADPRVANPRHSDA